MRLPDLLEIMVWERVFLFYGGTVPSCGHIYQQYCMYSFDTPTIITATLYNAPIQWCMCNCDWWTVCVSGDAWGNSRHYYYYTSGAGKKFKFYAEPWIIPHLLAASFTCLTYNVLVMQYLEYFCGNWSAFWSEWVWLEGQYLFWTKLQRLNFDLCPSPNALWQKVAYFNKKCSI